MKLLPSLLLLFVIAAFSSCSTVGDMVTATVPERHSGKPAVVVKLHEQQAYL